MCKRMLVERKAKGTKNYMSYNNEEIRQKIREEYRKIALLQSFGYSGGECCFFSSPSSLLGYTENEVQNHPTAHSTLGCGNPHLFAWLKEGETVLDLGSGSGLDCFLAAEKVGRDGYVYGLDMTPEMIQLAEENNTARREYIAEENNIACGEYTDINRNVVSKNIRKYPNIKFLLGEIENIPLPSNSIDTIISNCTINLSPEKNKVFHECFRVLKYGGSLVFSDIIGLKEMPISVQKDIALRIKCISGVSLTTEIENMLKQAGLCDITIEINEYSEQLFKAWKLPNTIHEYCASALVKAYKKRG